MHGVVAVHGPVPLEVTEAEEQRVALVELESSDVLPRNLHVGHPGELRADSRATAAKWAVGAGARGNPASARETAAIINPAQDAVLFQMDVDGVLPIVAGVNQHPVFGSVLLHRKAEGVGAVRGVAVGKLVVDDPLPVIAVEHEVPRDARRDNAGQLVERRVGRRINTVVRHCGSNPELHTRDALARSEDVAGWPLPIVLLQAVLQSDGGVAPDEALDLVEVNDDVVTLRHANPETGDLQGCGQEVAVIGDDPERYHRAGTERVGEKKLIEARGAAVEHAEAVAPLIDVEERLDNAVSQLDVADQPLEIERVEADQACGGIQQLVSQQDRDVELRVAGQMEAGGLISGVKLVEQEMEAFQALVGVFSGVVNAVVVIPEGAQGLIDIAVGFKVEVKSRLLRGEVVIEILSPEEPAAGPAVAFRSGMEVVQVRGHLRDSEAAILALVRQFVEAANQPRLLIVADDGGTGESGHVAGRRPAQVVSPNGLRRNVRVRGDPEIRIGPDALDEILLRRILVEELKAIGPWDQRAVELPAALKRKIPVVRVRSVVGTYLRRSAECQSRVGQRARLQLRRDGHGINERRSRLRAATYIAAAKAAPAEAARGGPGGGQFLLSPEEPRARHETHLHQVAPGESRLHKLQPVFQGILHCLPLCPRDSFSF